MDLRMKRANMGYSGGNAKPTFTSPKRFFKHFFKDRT